MILHINLFCVVVVFICVHSYHSKRQDVIMAFISVHSLLWGGGGGGGGIYDFL